MADASEIAERVKSSPQNSVFMVCEDCGRIVDTAKHGGVLCRGSNPRCRNPMTEHSRDELIALLTRKQLVQ